MPCIVLTALLLLAATDPAAAAFRYIPPASSGPDTLPGEPAVPGQPTNDAAPEQTGPGAAAPDVWRVHPGETLREVLVRWGARAGVAVVFLTDRGYRLHGGHAFEGEFFASVEALFSALGHLPHPPAAGRAPGGRSLTVTHRSRHSPATGVQP